MRAVAILAVVLFSVANSFAQLNAIPESDRQKRVPMTTYYSDSFFTTITTPDFTAEWTTDGGPILRGHDKSGKPWKVILPPTLRGILSTINDGPRTYYFAGITGVNGMANTTWILALSFDAIGRPAPFYSTTQYPSYDGKGLSNLVNLDGTGGLLLVQDFIRTGFGENDRGQGYFVTYAYQQRGTFWYRSDGRHGSQTYPIFQEWSSSGDYWANLKTVPRGQLPKLTLGNLGNDPSTGIKTTLRSVGNSKFYFGPELGCDPQSLYVIVLDSKDGRTIDVSAYNAPNQKLLTTIASEHLPVTITGLEKYPGGNECTASIIWVTNPKK